jgi:hypothetical protein
MRLLVQHLVGRNRGQYALQACWVWSMQEELLPEALGQLNLILIFLCIRERAAGRNSIEQTHLE